MSDDNDDLHEYEIRRRRKHAKAEARSAAKRRARNAPSRDDLCRAAYHTLLNVYAGTMTPQRVKDDLRLHVVHILRKAGFDLNEAKAAFDGDAVAPLDALNAWLCRRWIEDGRRLNDGRGRYKPLTGGRMAAAVPAGPTGSADV